MRILTRVLARKAQVREKGFTLVELVIVIVLLGVLSVGISGFLSMGSQIFVDVKNRSTLISTARFAIERVSRDIRSAVPNSIRLSDVEIDDDIRQCIEFTPIVVAASYLDIPALPGEAAGLTLSLIDFGDEFREKLETESTTKNLRVVVYPLELDDLYHASNSKIRELDVKDEFDISNDPEWTITLNQPILFAEDSPTSNIFFIADPISYCVFNRELRRYVGGNPNNTPTVINSAGVLMANNIHIEDASGNPELPFKLTPNSAQTRNSTVLFYLQLEKNDEIIVFNNEIHIPNVP